MRRTPGFWIHVAHVALLLITALDAPRDRRWSAEPPTRLHGPHGNATAPGAIGPPQSAEGAPDCPMPVWRPDPNVRYAAMVIEVDSAAADRRIEAAPCVNSYARAAASR